MPAPVGSHQDNRINQLLAALGQYVDAVTGTFTILQGTVIRVDKSGVDITGTRGRFDLPFLTIGAAMAVAQNGDTIAIGPGTYAENVVVTDTLTSLYIVGAGMFSTVINGAAGTALAWTGNATDLARLVVSNLTLSAAAGQALVINADAQLTSFDDTADARNGLILDRVFMQSTAGATAATLTAVNNVVMTNCFAGATDAFLFTLCSQVTVRNTELGGVTFSYTVAGNKPSNARRAKNLFNCRLASLTLTNLDLVVCDADCLVDNDITTTILDNALGLGTLEFHGICIGNMVLGHTLTLGARTAFLCDRCKLVGTLLSQNAGAGVQVATANFRNAVFYTAAAGGITAHNCAALDMIGAQFDHTVGVLVSLGVTPGTVNRSIHRQASAFTNPGPDAFVFAVPYIDANFTLAFETTVAAMDPIITAKPATGFTVQQNAGAPDAGATVVVIHE